MHISIITIFNSITCSLDWCTKRLVFLIWPFLCPHCNLASGTCLHNPCSCILIWHVHTDSVDPLRHSVTQDLLAYRSTKRCLADFLLTTSVTSFLTRIQGPKRGDCYLKVVAELSALPSSIQYQDPSCFQHLIRHTNLQGQLVCQLQVAAMVLIQHMAQGLLAYRSMKRCFAGFVAL